jgi:hypothetical protein
VHGRARSSSYVPDRVNPPTSSMGRDTGHTTYAKHCSRNGQVSFCDKPVLAKEGLRWRALRSLTMTNVQTETALDLPVLDGAMWLDSFPTLEEFDFLPLELPAYESPMQLSGTSASGDENNEPLRKTVDRESNGRASEKIAKKREIQARYRERQRAKREDLQERYENMVSALDLARSELVKVQGENSIMEAMLKVRDGAINALSKGKGYEDSSKIPKTCEDELLKNEAAPGAGAIIPVGLSTASGSNLLNCCVAEDCFQVFSKLSSNCSIHDFWRFPEDRVLDAAIKNESPEVFVAKWKIHAQTVARLTHELEVRESELRVVWGRQNTSNESRPTKTDNQLAIAMHSGLKDVVWQLFEEAREQISRTKAALRVNLPAVQALLSTAEEIQYGEAGKDAFWKDVLSDAQITLAQKQAMADVWHNYVRLSSGMEQRKAKLIEELSLTMHPRPYGTSLQSTMSQYVAVYDASQKLAQCENEEMFLLLEAMRDSGRVWSIKQKGKLISRCSPHYPNILEIMRVAADDC